MIFKPELVTKVLTGEKTQTRRKADYGACRYTVGRDYAVQPGRGKKSVARIRITDEHRELLSLISDEDARREGFDDKAAFFAYWRRLHGIPEDWSLDQAVHVISFELVTP